METCVLQHADRLAALDRREADLKAQQHSLNNSLEASKNKDGKLFCSEAPSINITTKPATSLLFTHTPVDKLGQSITYFHKPMLVCLVVHCRSSCCWIHVLNLPALVMTSAMSPCVTALPRLTSIVCLMLQRSSRGMLMTSRPAKLAKCKTWNSKGASWRLILLVSSATYQNRCF